MVRALVGTDDGLHEFDDGGRTAPLALAGRAVTVLAPDYPNVWAVLDGHELWALVDGAWTRRAEFEGRTATCVAGTVAGLLVGSSEAHLYRIDGDGVTQVAGFEAVEGRQDWYTPWRGPPDTRSIAEGDAVFVNVHVGGIVRSRDEGASWDPTIDIDADVHRVWADDELVLAACAGGLAVSMDLGTTWTTRADGLHAPYCRGVTVCGDAILVSASVGPRGGRAAVYRGSFPSADGLERCRDGLPEWFDENIDSACLDALPDGRLAALGTGDGRVYGSTDQGRSWDELAAGLPAVRCLTLVP